MGTPSIGSDQYISYLRKYITLKQDAMNQQKAKAILEFLKFNKNKEIVNIQDLFNTYQKWLDVFPFELPFFKDLKNEFYQKIPLKEEEFRYNPYTGLISTRIITPNELIEQLNGTTQILLDKVKSEILVKKGIINDIKQHRLTLLNSDRILKRNEMLKKNPPYLKILKKWIKDEQIYFKHLAEILNDDTKIYNINHIDNANFS